MCGVGEVKHLISLHGRIFSSLRERYQLVVEDAYLKLRGKCNSLESEKNSMQKQNNHELVCEIQKIIRSINTFSVAEQQIQSKLEKALSNGSTVGLSAKM